MDKDKQPGISFDSIMLVEDKFWRDYEISQGSDIDFKIDTEWSKNEDSYYVNLSPTIKLINDDGKEVLKLESKFVGIFSVIEGNENMNIEEYITRNSVALMFPYVREHISAITQKAGIKPILLPPINILAIVNQDQK